MNIRRNWKSMVTLTVLLGAGLAVPVWAHGGERGGRGRPEHPMGQPSAPRPMTPHARGLLGQLIYPCQAACDDTARDCYDAADTKAVNCISASDKCATQVGAAQTACQADRTSQACYDAVVALHTCSASCLETRNTDLTACRTALQSCRTACTTTP